MSNTNKYSALGTFTTAIAGDGSTPTLKSLADSGRKLGNEIDNTSSGNRDIYSNWQLKMKFSGGSLPTDIFFVELYFIKSCDGTNYEFGDDSTNPPPTSFIGYFQTRSVAGTQYLTLKNIVLPNCKFKPFIYNKTGKSFSAIDDDSILSYETLNIVNV